MVATRAEYREPTEPPNRCTSVVAHDGNSRVRCPQARGRWRREAREVDAIREMSIIIDMKRVTIAEAKQTLPALVHEAERRGEIELTRRGKPVAYLVSAEQHARIPRRGFIESLNQWLAAYASDLGDEALDIPPRRRARKVELPR
jgi:prevent-host-death family protein